MTVFRPIYLLAGPTASGKSAKALDWALKHGGQILNADAIQAYRDAPILSAAPSPDDLALVPHHLYGTYGPTEIGSVGAWIRSAKPYLDQALKGGPPVCVVGGTGLYFLSLIRGLAEIDEVSDETRSKCQNLFDTEGETAFRQALKRVDPQAEARISPQDRQRLVRAYGVWLETQKSLTDWQVQTQPVLKSDDYQFEILTPDRDWLYERCDRRFKSMIDNGGLEEVKRLLDQGLSADWPIMRTLGLAELSAYLTQHMDLASAIGLAQQKTRNYAKRQMTFFRNQFSR